MDDRTERELWQRFIYDLLHMRGRGAIYMTAQRAKELPSFKEWLAHTRGGDDHRRVGATQRRTSRLRGGQPMSRMSSEMALDAIHGLLSGTEWSPDTAEAIADIVAATGRRIEEPDAEPKDKPVLCQADAYSQREGGWITCGEEVLWDHDACPKHEVNQ